VVGCQSPLLITVPDLDRFTHFVTPITSPSCFLRDNPCMQCLKMSPVRSYRDLVAWQKSMALVINVYRCTQAFPKAETYGLAAQLRRATVSVPSNIAEGQGRISTGEFKQFLGHARGSLLEVETQITIAQGLGYLPQELCEPLLRQCAEVGRILNGLITSLKHK
jgi:four helix bundle protein